MVVSTWAWVLLTDFPQTGSIVSTCSSSRQKQEQEKSSSNSNSSILCMDRRESLSPLFWQSTGRYLANSSSGIIRPLSLLAEVGNYR
ncbi:hypothetical protein V8F20_008403 [Naviculisporaceae sp. PSN 640]